MRWLGLAVVLVIALGYVQPLRAYLDARDEVAVRQADIAVLDGERQRLERRLEFTGTDAFIEREARRLGLVRLASVFSSSRASKARRKRRYHDLVDDARVVSWQLGRRAKPFRRVAARCVHGFPAVTEQAPFGDDGEPFRPPTT